MDLARVKEMISPDMERIEDLIASTLTAETDSLKELVAHVARFGGKRLRPALVVIVSRALGETTEDHLKLGAVIELIHTASLVHDDILDEASMRRRTASVNELHGNHIPLLLGDLIYARAFRFSLSLSTPAAAERLAEVTEIICAGEIEQNFSRGRFDLSKDLYYRIIEAKTASLYGAACGLSALYAGASDDRVRALERYGIALGIAFQIVDDCLDIVGDEDVVGKSLGTDLEWGKMTLPLIHLASTLDDKDRARLETLYLRGGEDKLGAIRAEFDLDAAVVHAREVASRHVREALKLLDPLAPSPFKDALNTVGDFVLSRKL